MFTKASKAESEKTPKANQTGIPSQLKQRYEDSSGFSFDDVRVHYNSDKPAQLSALAYTQGNRIYVGPGNEGCLSHELGHVVQQKQGRVSPTGRLGDVPVNTDSSLEREADSFPSAVAGQSNAAVTEVAQMDPDPELIARIEEQVRSDIPAAFNQKEDLLRDSSTWLNWQKTKAGMRDLIAQGVTIGRSVRDLRTRRISDERGVLIGSKEPDKLDDMLSDAVSARQFHGGACNDFSALAATYHLASSSMEPLTRYWDDYMGHSFDVVGDPRTRGARVLDPWTTTRDPRTYLSTVLSEHEPVVVNQWKPRMPTEGQQVIKKFMRGFDHARFIHSADDLDEREDEFADKQKLLMKDPRSHIFTHDEHDPRMTTIPSYLPHEQFSPSFPLLKKEHRFHGRQREQLPLFPDLSRGFLPAPIRPSGRPVLSTSTTSSSSSSSSSSAFLPPLGGITESHPHPFSTYAASASSTGPRATTTISTTSSPPSSSPPSSSPPPASSGPTYYSGSFSAASGSERLPPLHGARSGVH